MAIAALLVIGLVSAYMLNDLNKPETIVESTPAIAQPKEPPTDYQPPVLVGHRDIHEAYHDLFALWGIAFEDRDRDPYDQVREIGLMCMQRQVNWAELLEINRPGIVRIDEQYLILSEIQGNLVTLFAGSGQFELTRQDFDGRFDGSISMVWRMPPDYQAPLKVHDRGAAVDWLVMQMAVIDGDTPPLETGFTFSEGLEARVRDFQASVGLKPSGIVDPMTWIHINSVEAVSIPTLSSGGRG